MSQIASSQERHAEGAGVFLGPLGSLTSHAIRADAAKAHTVATGKLTSDVLKKKSRVFTFLAVKRCKEKEG